MAGCFGGLRGLGVVLGGRGGKGSFLGCFGMFFHLWGNKTRFTVLKVAGIGLHMLSLRTPFRPPWGVALTVPTRSCQFSTSLVLFNILLIINYFC